MKKLWLLILAISFLTGCESESKIPFLDPDVQPSLGVLPFEDFPESTILSLADSLRIFYDIKIVYMKPQNLPDGAWYEPRSRYRADSLLNYMSRNRPDSLDFILGLTEMDISVTNGEHEDWGVFGLGQLPGRIGVVSTYRLKRKLRGENNFNKRLSRVARHEIGHILGLPHCKNAKCFMRDAEGTINTIDQEGSDLCQQCRRKISFALKAS